MNSEDLKKITEDLIETFKKAGDQSIKIQKQGLKKITNRIRTRLKVFLNTY